MISEGEVRDLVRKVQNLRKDSKFDISDRVCVKIDCSDKIYGSIESYEKYFKNETLCSHIDRSSNIDYDFKVSFVEVKELNSND